MHHPRSESGFGWVFIAFLAGAIVAGCGGGPASPSDVSVTGGWSGTTSQGQVISFVVSDAEQVTGIRVRYNFNGCAGELAVADLNIVLYETPSTYPRPGKLFTYASGSPDAGNYVRIDGRIATASTADGTVGFVNFGSCGSATVTWRAGKD